MHLSNNFSAKKMKKIKSIQQLRAKKEQVILRLNYLELKMQQQLNELKQELRPAAIIKNSIGTILRKNAEHGLGSGGILKSALTFGIGVLVSKLADKARKKFTRV